MQAEEPASSTQRSREGPDEAHAKLPAELRFEQIGDGPYAEIARRDADGNLVYHTVRIPDYGASAAAPAEPPSDMH